MINRLRYLVDLKELMIKSDHSFWFSTCIETIFINVIDVGLELVTSVNIEGKEVNLLTASRKLIVFSNTTDVEVDYNTYYMLFPKQKYFTLANIIALICS